MFYLDLHQYLYVLRPVGAMCLQFGMGLSNPLHGDRRPGFVGEPLPGVEVSQFFQYHISESRNNDRFL